MSNIKLQHRVSYSVRLFLKEGSQLLVCNVMELSRVKINLSIKLDEISPKYETRLQQGFQNFGKTILEIPFFLAENVRVEKDEDEGKISDVSRVIEDWLESHFGVLCTREYYAKVATQAIICEYFLVPEHDIDSDIILRRSYKSALALVIDDVVDGDLSIPNENIDGETLLRLFQKGFLLTLKIGYEAAMWAELGKSGGPFFKSFFSATSDAFNKLKLNNNGITDFMLALLPGVQCECWIKQNFSKGPEAGGLNVYRKFRALNSGASVVPDMYYGMDYEPLPVHVRRNPVFVNWKESADQIGGCLNDIFGFIKDVRNGERDGVIMYRIINCGTDPRTAVDAEAAILTEAVHHYLILRRMLIEVEKEAIEYIKTVDGQLYGWLQAFAKCSRFGLKKVMVIIPD